MTLTATTRRCGACGALVLDEHAACTVCGAVPCPLIEAWPADVAPWLSAMHSAFYFWPVLALTRQQRAEWLLRGVVAGHQWGNRIVKLAAPSVECLPIAQEQALRWAACGRPKDAAEMIKLAGVRR